MEADDKVERRGSRGPGLREGLCLLWRIDVKDGTGASRDSSM